jgi:immune inhibitor A
MDFPNYHREPLPTTIVNPQNVCEDSSAGEDNEISFENDSNEVVEDGALFTLSALEGMVINENNPMDLAYRFKGVTAKPDVKSKVLEKKIGGIERFWVLNVDSNQYRQVDAELLYKTDHLYFWIQEDTEYNAIALAELAETFEKHIYPITRSLFGSELSPGVDEDVHLTILFARDLGGVAGYFSATDSLRSQIEPYSNESEMFYLSADYTWLDSIYTYGVLAHEFQHMIHWNVDRNENAWVNEGLSELAADLAGYYTSGMNYLFMNDPDLQLSYWPGNDQGDSSPHYGASYLFIRYLYDRFGSEFISKLVAEQKNGFSGIDVTLDNYAKDNNLGTMNSEEVFQDWTLANLLQDFSRDDKFGYKKELILPDVQPKETLKCNGEIKEFDVTQFGTDYFKIDCTDDFQIEIDIEENIPLLPVDPSSGEFYYWSNYGHESHMRLSKDFDFRDVDGPIILQYQAWFDIERDYDYLFLTLKLQDGNWIILEPTSCTTENPVGANLGCGYNGLSNGWIQESVDLSMYAGQEVLIQFEYITDAAVNGDGFLIDDIRIDAMGYDSDLDKDDGGWEADGFVRIQNQLPHRIGISYLVNDSKLNLDKNIVGQDHISSVETGKNKIWDKSWLIISGLTRYTMQHTNYKITLSKIE